MNQEAIAALQRKAEEIARDYWQRSSRPSWISSTTTTNRSKENSMSQKNRSAERPVKIGTIDRRLSRQDNPKMKPVPPSKISKLDMLGLKKG